MSEQRDEMKTLVKEEKEEKLQGTTETMKRNWNRGTEVTYNNTNEAIGHTFLALRISKLWSVFPLRFVRWVRSVRLVHDPWCLF